MKIIEKIVFFFFVGVALLILFSSIKNYLILSGEVKKVEGVVVSTERGSKNGCDIFYMYEYNNKNYRGSFFSSKSCIYNYKVGTKLMIAISTESPEVSCVAGPANIFTVEKEYYPNGKLKAVRKMIRYDTVTYIDTAFEEEILVVLRSYEGIEYFSNGKLKRTSKILAGKKEGRWINRDSLGRLTSVEYYKNDSLVIVK